MNPDESFQAGIPAREIRSLFAEAAVRAGVIRPGDPIDQMQVDFATEIVTLCARLTDRYSNPECTEDTIGDVIRGSCLSCSTVVWSKAQRPHFPALCRVWKTALTQAHGPQDVNERCGVMETL